MSKAFNNKTKLNNIVDVVADFGAVGDGVADDTAAIQSAIDAVYAAGGGELWFKPGKYKISSTLKLKRHVALVGPKHRIPTASLYGTSFDLEATIIGMAQIVPTAALTGRAIHWDFKLADEVARPYGATIHNLLIDLAACTGSVDGVYVETPPVGEGVFDNGWAGGAAGMYGCVVMNAPRYGVFVESTPTQRVNLQIIDSRIAFSGSHGIYCLYCYDMNIVESFSFDNNGDGLRMEGCATERVRNCDFFNNDGNGITLDGFDGRYDSNAIENNKQHGVQILATTTAVTNKRYRFVAGRIGTNSYDNDNLYDNVRVEDRSGTSCAEIYFVGVVFGPQAHATSARVRHAISVNTLPAQSPSVVLSGCSFPCNDVKSGNSLFNTTAWESMVFEGSLDPGGQLLAQEARALTAWTGVGNPNILRGVNYFRTQNTGSATLIGFSAGSSRLEGREVWILIDDVNTGVDFTGTTLKGNGGVDLPAGASTQGKLLHFKNIDGTNWAATIYG